MADCILLHHILQMKLNYEYQALDGRLIKNMTLIGTIKRWLLNRGLIYHSFLQFFWDFDYCPLHGGWPLNRGSTVFLYLTYAQCSGHQNFRQVATGINHSS